MSEQPPSDFEKFCEMLQREIKASGVSTCSSHISQCDNASHLGRIARLFRCIEWWIDKHHAQNRREEHQAFTIDELQDIQDRAQQMFAEALRSEDPYARIWMRDACQKLTEGVALLQAYLRVLSPDPLDE